MQSLPEFQTEFAQWQCTAPVSTAQYQELVRQMNLTGSKWDTQIGDDPILSPYALIIPSRVGKSLAGLAEKLSKELSALEAELSGRPELWSHLGLNREVLRALRLNQPWTPAATRVVRYDFHPTAEGWKLSEINSDVPGGFNEASTFTRAMAGHFPGLSPAGDPLARLADSLANAAGPSRRVALLCAPGYTEDWQVACGLRDALQARGIIGILARPQQLNWLNGLASFGPPERPQAIGCIYRFFQGEWLWRTPPGKWIPLLRGGLTPVCNPGVSLLTESKRLPLLSPALHTNCPTWRRVSPSAKAPWLAARGGFGRWVLKGAYSNTGESVASTGWQSRAALARHWAGALLRPRSAVAQQRFETLPFNTPNGPRYSCFGVYTIDGTAAGLYARLSAKPVIDYSASDVAILLRG